MAAEYNFEIEKGSTLYTSFEYRDENNNIINLTNYCARFSMVSLGDSPQKYTFVSDVTNNDYSLIIQPALGKIILQLSSSFTESFNFDSAVYDLDLKSPNESFPGGGQVITRLLRGSIGILSRNVIDPAPFDCNVSSDPDQCITCE